MAEPGKRAVRLALEEARGVVSKMAEILEVTRPTVYKYLSKYELWDQLQVERERLLILAENNIAGAVEDGDIETSKWVAARLGKNVWAARNEHTGADGEPLLLSAQAMADLQALGLDPEGVKEALEGMIEAQRTAQQKAAEKGPARGEKRG